MCSATRQHARAQNPGPRAPAEQQTCPRHAGRRRARPDPAPRAAQDQCAFNGAWGGGRKPTAFYVSSYFWDRATDAGIIADEGAITWTLKPDDLGAAAQKACAASAAKVADLFPKARPMRARRACSTPARRPAADRASAHLGSLCAAACHEPGPRALVLFLFCHQLLPAPP